MSTRQPARRLAIAGLAAVLAALLPVADVAADAAVDAVAAGNNAYFAGDWAAAEGHFADAIAGNDSWAVGWNNRGLARYRQGAWSAAESDFEEAKVRNPAWIAPYLNKAKTRAAQGDLVGAVTELDAGLAIDPAHPKLLYSKGWIRDEQGLYGDAIALFDAALAVDPDHLRALLAKAVSLAKDGQVAAAADGFYAVVNAAGSGNVIAAMAAYDLQLLRGPTVHFDSDAAAQAHLGGLHKMSLSLYDQAAALLATAHALEGDVPHTPWLQAVNEILRRDFAAAGTFLPVAYALMPTVAVDSPLAANVLLDGIPRGRTPVDVPLFASRFDLTVRRLDATDDRSRTIPLYADGTPGGQDPVVITPGVVAPLPTFGPVDDSDSDWLGDGWESAWFGDLSHGPDDDEEPDGVINLLEQWHGGDPGLDDTDADGLTDADEIASGADPSEPDADGDRVPDAWEVTMGLDPAGEGDLDLDPDGDGLPSYGEWLLGTDPNDSTAPVKVHVNGTTGSDVTGDGSSGNPYATIQHGVDSAAPPAIIAVAAGSYPEHLVLADGIAVVGAGADSTVLDAAGSGRPMTLDTGSAAAAAVVDLTVTGGAFSGYGGGVFASLGDLYLRRAHVRDNRTLNAYQHGGGIHVRHGALRMVDAVVGDNHTHGSAAYGGGVFLLGSESHVVSSLIDGNTGSFGQGLCTDGGSLRLRSSTLARNGYRSLYTINTDVGIFDTIIWNDTEDVGRAGGRVTVDRSLIGDVPWDYDADGNVRWLGLVLRGADPGFIDHAGGDLRLRPDSPCIDLADGDRAPATDLDGQARWDDPRVADVGVGATTFADIGVHEMHDVDLDGMTDGWEVDRFGDLSHGAGDDTDGDGLTDLEEFDLTTDPNDDDSDDDGLLDGWEQDNGLDPLDAGGDNGGGGDPDGDGLDNLGEQAAGTDPHHLDTERDGLPDGWEVANGFAPLAWDADWDGDVDGLSTYSEYVIESDPHLAASPQIVYVDGATGSDLTGDGSHGNPYATIQHGIDQAVPPARVAVAAGVYPERITVPDRIAVTGAGREATVLDAQQIGRVVTGAPGARVVLARITITGGRTADAGGGIACDGCASLALTGVAVLDNETTGIACSGGGALVLDAVLRVVDSTFAGNRTLQEYSHGGGIYVGDGRNMFVSTLFADNDSAHHGEAFFGGSPESLFIACTFADHPGVPIFLSYSNAEMYNTVVWDNDGAIFVDTGTVTIAHSNLEDADRTGPGVIHDPPLWVDFGSGDYRLLPTSPGIDAGDGDLAPPRDHFGHARADLPGVPNTGVGDPQTVDMGFAEVALPVFLDGLESGDTSSWSASVP